MDKSYKKIVHRNDKLFSKLLFIKKLNSLNSNKYDSINSEISNYFSSPENFLEENSHIFIHKKIKIERLNCIELMKQSLKSNNTTKSENGDKVLSTINKFSQNEKSKSNKSNASLSKNYELIDNEKLKTIFDSYKKYKTTLLKKNLLTNDNEKKENNNNENKKYDPDLCDKNIPRQLSMDLNAQSRKLNQRYNLENKSRQISKYLSRKLNNSENSLLFNSINFYRFKKQILENETTKGSQNFSNNIERCLFNWISSLRRPKDFNGRNETYVNVGSKNENPLWSTIAEKRPLIKEISVKAGTNLDSKYFYRFIKNERLNSVKNNKIKNMEDLDQIKIRGKKLLDLEYDREMSIEKRKFLHKSFMDNGKLIMYKDVNNLFGHKTIYKNYIGRNYKKINSGSQSMKNRNKIEVLKY